MTDVNITLVGGERSPGKLNPQVDYLSTDKPFVIVRFISECGAKLDTSCMTVATASVLFHRFRKATKEEIYDNYLVAAACLYIAGKIEDTDRLRLRDIVNVVHSTLHKQKTLDLDSEYYALREAIVQAEFVVLRMIAFQTQFVHPHKFLLHYLKSLKAWIAPEVWKSSDIANTSWSLLQDFYHNPSILDVDPKTLSLACIQIALQTFGVQVPLMEDSSDQPWHMALYAEASRDKIWEVMAKVMEMYSYESAYIPIVTRKPNITL